MIKFCPAAFAALCLTVCVGSFPLFRAQADPASVKAAPISALSFVRVGSDMDARLAGKTPSPATQNLFKTYDNAAHAYVRNPECFAAGIDLSCISVANTANADGTGGNRGCVTLVTPLHGVTNQHFGQPYQRGVVHYFVDAASKVYPRKIVNAAQVGATDIEVVTFDAPLPASVRPASLLSLEVTKRLLSPGMPALATNQQKQAVITELVGMANGEIFVRPATAPERKPWTATPPAVLGDSDSPTFLVLDRRPCLLFTYHTSASGPALSENLADIRALLGSGYAPDVVTVR